MFHEFVVFRITLIYHFKHGNHALAMPWQQLKLAHHVFPLLAIQQS